MASFAVFITSLCFVVFWGFFLSIHHEENARKETLSCFNKNIKQYPKMFDYINSRDNILEYVMRRFPTIIFNKLESYIPSLQVK